MSTTNGWNLPPSRRGNAHHREVAFPTGHRDGDDSRIPSRGPDGFESHWQSGENESWGIRPIQAGETGAEEEEEEDDHGEEELEEQNEDEGWKAGQRPKRKKHHGKHDSHHHNHHKKKHSGGGDGNTEMFAEEDFGEREEAGGVGFSTLFKGKFHGAKKQLCKKGNTKSVRQIIIPLILFAFLVACIASTKQTDPSLERLEVGLTRFNKLPSILLKTLTLFVSISAIV